MEGENGFHFNTESYFEAFVLHVACYVRHFNFTDRSSMWVGFWYITPPIYEQVLDAGGILLSASGGKCGNVLTAWNWSYSWIVVVCLPQTSMPEL